MSNFNLVTDARLAQGSYFSNNQSNTTVIDGWRPIYVDPQDLKLSTTFGAQLYKNDAGQYKVVFRGTEGNLADWAQNLKYGTFQWSDEFKDTIGFMAKAVVQVAKEQDKTVQEAAKLFTTTGHSQGGFEAELAALMFGVKGTSLDGMGATGVVDQFRTELNKAMQDNGAGDLVRTDAVLRLKTDDFLTRIYTAVGRLGVHTGETDGAWSWSVTKLVSVFNPALAGAAIVGGLRAHMVADIVANEELRERSPLWRVIGDAGDVINPFDTPTKLAQSVANRWASVQVADASGALPTLPDSSHIQSQLQSFLQDHSGQNYDQQTLGKNVLVRMQGGDTLMIYADGTVKVVAKIGETTTVREYAKDGSLQAARQERPDGLGNTIVNEQGVGFEGSMTVSGTGQVISARSSTYQGTDLKSTIDISTQTVNGQSVQVTETVNHLAKGTEIASSKELVTSGGAKIVNSTTADGHIQEDTWATVDGKQTLQSSKIISYSQAERDTAALDVSLAGLELMQALRSGNKVQAAGSLIRLVNNAEIASNQMPTLGAIGTGFSGAVSLISALDSWGNASDGERIALTARAVLGANEVAKAFSANGQTGFLDSSAALGALQGVVALSNLESTIKSKNPFAIASSVMALTNSAVAVGAVSSSTAAAAFGMEAVSEAAVFGPEAMIAVAIASIVFGSLFGGDIEYPEPPPAGSIEIGRLADGTLGMLIKDADGKLYQTRKITGAVVSDSGKATDNQDWGLGANVLSQRVVTLIGELQAQANKDGTHLVLDRLPILSVHGYPSFERNGVDNFFFALRFNDPGTGAQQLMAAANQDMAKQFKEIASYAGAVVGNTEWAQIQAKQAAGDSYATETEGQYVDRLSGTKEGDSLLTKAQADAQEASNRQSYSLLTLDLEGNGITRRAQQAAGMKLEDVQADTTRGITRLDVDNDGFMELTEWVGSKEAILGLDRNGDGQLSTADELFSGGELSDAAEGLGIKRLAFFDANKDGKLDKLDAYFNSFKLWLDINGDARTGVGELYGLADAGIKSINVSTGAVSFTDGQTITLQRTQLSADVRGVAVSAVPDGKGGVLTGQYKVQQEGKDAELNLTADAATDLSDILKLVRPGANVTDAEKTQLKALAAKYGVDLNNPAALLGLGGGGNVAGSATSTTATAADVFTISQAPNADEIKKALRAFYSVINHDPDAGPNLVNHVLEAQEDTQVKIKTADLLAGLTGVKLVSVQEARRGAVKLDANGDVVFDPLANQNGTGYFTYTAKDSQGRVSTAMVWLTIASVNDAPVALADAFSVKEDNTLTLAVSQLLANDTDADIATDANEKITVTAVGKASHGSVSLVNGQVVFKTEADYQGTASFEYTVSDVAGATATATATVTVVGENDAPVTAGNVNKIAAKPDTLLRIEAATLLAYVKDADLVYGDSLKLKQVVSVSAGIAWQQKDGSVLFKAGALGDAVLKLEVADSQGSTVVVPITINVASGNAAAATLLPGIDQASEDTAVRIGSTQLITGVVSTLNGSALIDKDGSVVPAIMPNATASTIAMKYDVQGGCWTIANACASSALALGQAMQAIRAGQLDAAIVGGSEAMLVPGMLHTWARSRVVAIHVKDGDDVVQGQRLVELDATLATADREKSGQDAEDAHLDVLRLGAQLKGLAQLPQPPDGASAVAVERQKHLLMSRVGEQHQKMAVLTQEVARKSADLATTLASIKKIEDALPMLQQRLTMRDKLWKEGFMAEVAVIESRLEVSTQVNELAVLKERLKESQSALKAAELAKSQAQAEYISRVSAEMTDAQRRMHAGHQEFVKASYREAYQVLTAPISGTVQQLAVNTVGGVVNATQGLMTVVPKEGGIEVEAQVLNKDIGFLRVGMPVAVKLDAFEFTKYGSLQGVVQWVGADAVKHEQLGQVFPVRIVLKQTKLPVDVDGNHPEIRIGMSVTADVAIGKRKAYEFFLGPLLKYKNESLRER